MIFFRPLSADKDPLVQQESNVAIGTQRGGFRKLLMKISEKIGATEKTEYKQCFQEMCKEIDEYKVRESCDFSLITSLMRHTNSSLKSKKVDI